MIQDAFSIGIMYKILETNDFIMKITNDVFTSTFVNSSALLSHEGV